MTFFRFHELFKWNDLVLPLAGIGYSILVFFCFDTLSPSHELNHFLMSWIKYVGTHIQSIQSLQRHGHPLPAHMPLVNRYMCPHSDVGSIRTNSSVLIRYSATTRCQKSISATWHTFYKTLEFYWREDQCSSERFPQLVFCWWGGGCCLIRQTRMSKIRLSFGYCEGCYMI